MHDLFSQEQEIETIPIPDGNLKFVHALYSENQSQHFYQHLLEQTLWREEQIEVWGKLYQQPRLCAWYGDQGSDYSYSGIHLIANAWTSTLNELKHQVEAISERSYNSVLVNLYRDQHDSVGWHSDDEPELGRQPTIASLSFGEKRLFKLRHKFDKTIKPISIALPSGCLLIMEGNTQHHWEHAIIKETRACQPRINLTFRQIKKKD